MFTLVPTLSLARTTQSLPFGRRLANQPTTRPTERATTRFTLILARILVHHYQWLAASVSNPFNCKCGPMTTCTNSSGGVLTYNQSGVLNKCCNYGSPPPPAASSIPHHLARASPPAAAAVARFWLFHRNGWLVGHSIHSLTHSLIICTHSHTHPSHKGAFLLICKIVYCYKCTKVNGASVQIKHWLCKRAH